MTAPLTLPQPQATPTLPTPAELHAELPLSLRSQQEVHAAREDVRAILDGRDDRLLVITGPCSIHDEEQALEYATRLARLRHQVQDRLCVLMRVYVDKPRTTTGWRGYMLDPHMDGSFDLAGGLRRTRDLTRRILDLGVPAATEVLDPLLPPYLEDLYAWTAVGARTTESQTHRAVASNLSMPVGFKNGTNGDVTIALDAVTAARASQPILTIGFDGRVTSATTPGNAHAHVILRGSRGEPNHHERHVRNALTALRERQLPPALVVDCSHGNSGYQHERQVDVLRDVIAQRQAGQSALKGVMIESHLHAGKQVLTPHAPLTYGVSVTDACVSWEATEAMLLEAHAALS